MLDNFLRPRYNVVVLDFELSPIVEKPHQRRRILTPGRVFQIHEPDHQLWSFVHPFIDFSQVFLDSLLLGFYLRVDTCILFVDYTHSHDTRLSVKVSPGNGCHAVTG